jgi:hypothetical protein
MDVLDRLIGFTQRRRGAEISHEPSAFSAPLREPAFFRLFFDDDFGIKSK